MPKSFPAQSETKPLILIVEDEAELSKVIALHLARAGMHTQTCGRGHHAVKFLQKNFVNLVLLDVNLPDQSGFALIEELKLANIKTPVIFVTGNIEETSKVRGLNLGGDDYVTKPFSYRELIARIQAVLRRTAGLEDLNLTPNVLVTDAPFIFCGARVSPSHLEIQFPSGALEKIGPKEIGIMACLHAHAGAVVTREALIHAVWGIHANLKSRSLDQYVRKLRARFLTHGISMDALSNVHGVGYVIASGSTARGTARSGLPSK